MAGKLVNMGSLLKCSMGITPSSLVVTAPTVMAQAPPAANIMDCVPMSNILTFGTVSYTHLTLPTIYSV